MATQDNDNGFLYFIVGGLLVAAIVGFFVMDGGSDMSDGPSVIERTERTIERTTDNDNNTTGFEMRVDGNGASATSTQAD